MVPAGVRHFADLESGGRKVAVLIVRDPKVPAGITLRIRGDRPLVILVNGRALIDGTIQFDGYRRGGPATADVCLGDGGGGTPLGTQQRAGSGGGGGSLGGGRSGENGGGTEIEPPGVAGMPFATTTAIPLLMGCDGGRGGATVSFRGGRGGGGIEISALDEIIVNGVVAASGDGGAGGDIGAVPGRRRSVRGCACRPGRRVGYRRGRGRRRRDRDDPDQRHGLRPGCAGVAGLHDRPLIDGDPPAPAVLR